VVGLLSCCTAGRAGPRRWRWRWRCHSLMWACCLSPPTHFVLRATKKLAEQGLGPQRPPATARSGAKPTAAAGRQDQGAGGGAAGKHVKMDYCSGAMWDAVGSPSGSPQGVNRVLSASRQPPSSRAQFPSHLNMCVH